MPPPKGESAMPSAGRHLAPFALGACLLITSLLRGAPAPLSPGAIAVSPDGRTLFVAAETGSGILVFDPSRRDVVRRIKVPDHPSGLALTRDGARLIVTSAAPTSTVTVLATATGRTLASHRTGYHALAPVLSPDERTLYVCNRFNHEVQAIDLATGATVHRIRVPREPVAQALTPDGRRLLVANHLPAGRSDAVHVAAVVSLIDPVRGEHVRDLLLPSGSTLLRGIACSPDGRIAAVSHLLARFQLPTTQLERGWVMTNALTLIDVSAGEILNTLLLDDIDAGAANPWAVAWTADGAQLLVTHAGTHELSVIDAAGVLARLAALPLERPAAAAANYGRATLCRTDVPNDLAFLGDLRRRVKLPGKGPRALAVAGTRAFVPLYFSDLLAEVDLSAAAAPGVTTSPLGPAPAPTAARRGELAWNDATLAFQGWLSCSSCHSSDARVDGLNWDNLNDGIGNPKNAKSMLLAFDTPPTTSLGVRETAAVSVRSGIKHILFAVQPEPVAQDIEAFIRSLRPMPSPHLVKGRPSPAAQRGAKLFRSKRAGCAECHSPPLFTDLKTHDIGTRGAFDAPEDTFDVPTLIEAWRSAPYLHDGSAVTIRDVLTTRNPQGRHGRAADLTPDEIDDLCAYVLSL